MSDLPINAIRFPKRPRPLLRLITKEDCQGERIADANDIILADLEMLVRKSDALIGIERTNQTLPGRLDLMLAARAIGRKG